MTKLLQKFRVDWETDVVSMGHMDDSERGGNDTDPSPETIAAYNALPGVVPLDQQVKPEWGRRWLRIAELVRENSSGSKMVRRVLRLDSPLPRPRKWTEPFRVCLRTRGPCSFCPSLLAALFSIGRRFS